MNNGFFASKIKRITPLLIATLLLSILLVPIFALRVGAQDTASPTYNPLKPSCDSLPANKPSPICEDTKGTADPVNGKNGVINRIATIIAVATSAIAVIIIVISGIRMSTSQGDAGAVKSARDSIIYAAVGIVIVVLARSIVLFILGRL